MKSARRKAREDALQVLYQLELNKTTTPEAALADFEALYQPQGDGLDDFTRRVVLGVCSAREAIDQQIRAHSTHWKMERMPAVDRALLRMGVYELEYCDDIPATVSINEMIDLAKEFGSDNSAGFINGVLDKVKAGLNRPEKAQ